METDSDISSDLHPDRLYQAILARDRRFDGRFFTGVVTTGIYCRPVCPVSPPKLRNMRFYPCAAAAEAAGFRPCKRCRPETAPGTPAWRGTSAVVSRALRLIEAGALDDGDGEALASRLGLGERQLRRLFAQHLGASPADVARARRVHFARRLLDQTDLAVTEVAMASGFASIRQFNHAVKATFGAAPTALRGARRLGDGAARGLHVKLPYRAPLAWNAMLAFLAPRAIPGVEAVEDGAYRRTVRVDDVAAVVEIRPAAAVRGEAKPHHAAHLVMTADAACTRGLIGLVERARRLFDLGADSAFIDERLRESAVLATLVDAMPGLRVPCAWDGFELAVRAVLGQQVTVTGATTLAGRVVRTFGTALPQPRGALTHLFPKAEDLADADLAVVGLPRARAAALRNLATAVAEGRVSFDTAAPLDEAVRQLTLIDGIGPWTAQYVAMRALGEPDAFPDSDLGLRHALGNGQSPASVAAVREAAEAWRPWRSYAAMHLWSALAAGRSSKENPR